MGTHNHFTVYKRLEYWLEVQIDDVVIFIGQTVCGEMIEVQRNKSRRLGNYILVNNVHDIYCLWIFHLAIFFRRIWCCNCRGGAVAAPQFFTIVCGANYLASWWFRLQGMQHGGGQKTATGRGACASNPWSPPRIHSDPEPRNRVMAPVGRPWRSAGRDRPVWNSGERSQAQQTVPVQRAEGAPGRVQSVQGAASPGTGFSCKNTHIDMYRQTVNF